MADHPASDYDAIEDARETVAGIRELERISAAFDRSITNLGQPTLRPVGRHDHRPGAEVRPGRGNPGQGPSGRSRPKGPPPAKFLDPHPRIKVL